MKRVYVDPDVCMGCGLCEVYCLTQHSRSLDILKAYRQEKPRPVARIRVERHGNTAFGFQCRQCSEPLCVYACVSGATFLDDHGQVAFDESRCIGCWTCVLACPYGAIARDDARERVARCDLCGDPQGDGLPACVRNCPNEALSVREEAV
ncbi:MAG: 4Fe-4S dicluster domain-containing protein [Firmicutes bacterium]|nr:4Fe-4S dicluster domain-containing protein [Bacillota bacterium]